MSARILLVDDHETNLATLEAILAPEGYELHAVSDGEAACAAAVSLAPDLILLDVMMPGMDGYAVCRKIRETPAVTSVPIMMVTALHDRESRLAGIAAGADDFISKPFPVEELRVRIRTITRLNRYRAIADQRARFERLFELAPSAIVVADAGGAVVSSNRRAAALFSAFSAPLETGKKLAAGWPDAACARLDELLRVADPDPAANAFAGPCELRLPGADGDRVFHVSAARLDERPAPLALLSFDDITAEARAREQVESMNRRLDALVRERTTRLEEANQLLMSYALFVAHDLRSPLSAMKGYVSLLLGGMFPVGPEVRDCLARAASAAGMMEEMISDTLALASDEHAGRRPERMVDPRSVIERLCGRLTAFRPAPRPRVIIHPLPRVCASELMLERVFFNLVSNALKYSARSADPLVEIGARDTPEGPALFVRDNGVGFSPGEAEALFADFSRLSSAEGHDGVGLGLALVARLVRSIQGRIWAEGSPGRGATFYVLFPTPAPAGAASPPCPAIS